MVHDLALQGLDMTLCIDRAGIVGEDGETHQGLLDIPMLMPIPGISIYAPTSYGELRVMLESCLLKGKGISAIRYPRGHEPDMQLPFTRPEEAAEWLGTSKELCVISYGRQVVSCLQGIRSANKQVSFLKLNRIFPIEEEIVRSLMQYKKILLIEEGYQVGGIGAYLGNQLINRRYQGTYRNFGIENQFLKSGKPADLLSACHLDGESVARMIIKFGELE